MIVDIKELNELLNKGVLSLVKTSFSRGYVSVKSKGILEEYQGRYGKGYKVYSNNPDSTRFCYVSYYIYN